MSRALLARSLAEDEGDVLMVDWDLEAPGLHRYFGSFCRFGLGDPPDRDRALDERLGLLDFFEELKSNIAERDEGTDRVDEDATRKLIEQVGCDRFVIRTDIPRLHLMKAGRFDATYASRIGKFNWEQLHTLAPTLFRSVSEFLAERYQYVLIDSRTGLTDTSGICTMLMPERLVVVFTPNRQSLTGVLELVRNATKYRRQSSDLRPLIVYPLPSRVELSEEALRHTWRLGDASNGIVGYQALFESMLADVYGLTECDLGDYFDDIQIQHVPRYAFGEEIAALIEPRVDSLSLTRSYARFAQRIQTSSRAWDTAPSSAAAPAGPGVTVAEPPAMPPAPASGPPRRELAARGNGRVADRRCDRIGWPRRIRTESVRARVSARSSNGRTYSGTGPSHRTRASPAADTRVDISADATIRADSATNTSAGRSDSATYTSYGQADATPHTTRQSANACTDTPHVGRQSAKDRTTR